MIETGLSRPGGSKIGLVPNSRMRALARRIRLGGSGGMLPKENVLKLDALRWLLRPFLGTKTSLEVFVAEF